MKPFEKMNSLNQKYLIIWYVRFQTWSTRTSSISFLPEKLQMQQKIHTEHKALQVTSVDCSKAQNFESWSCESWRMGWKLAEPGYLQHGLATNTWVTTQIHQTKAGELDFNTPFSFHFRDFPPLGLQTVVSLTLLFLVPRFRDTDSTELVPVPSCDDTGAHSHEQSL